MIEILVLFVIFIIFVISKARSAVSIDDACICEQRVVSEQQPVIAQQLPCELLPQCAETKPQKKHKKVRFSETAHMRQFNSSVGDIVQEDSVVTVH